MANKHMKHTDLGFKDIIDIEKQIINIQKLEQLIKQVNDTACYDKVGSWFYQIESGKNRNINHVRTWLNHLSTLEATAETVGYTHTRNAGYVR